MSDDIQRNVSVVPQPSEEYLNRSQRPIYRSLRESFIGWLKTTGKNEDNGTGYAFSTVRRTAHDHDNFFRWTWKNHGGFTKSVGTDLADDYLGKLRRGDSSDTNKANKLKSLKRYYRWRNIDWEPEVTFNGDDGKGNPQDWLTKDERKAVRETALELGTVPDYDALKEATRDDWEKMLARRFRVPQTKINRSHFEKANGFKVPSLVWVSLDAGLRPIEVGRAKVEWCDTQNARLLIPREDDSKGENENWSVVLNNDTNEILKNWLQERQTYEKYDESNRIWLTREGQHYSSRTCNYLFEKLLEQADILTHRRDLTWYSMRHSTGTYMTNEMDLKGAAQQLRHSDTSTTERYNHPDEDEQRNALDNIEE